MKTEITRRGFVKSAVAVSAALTGTPQAITHAVVAKSATAAPAAGGELPRGRIGKLQISRILLGGNLLTHFTHSRDLRYVYNLAKHYNTDAKILETLAVAEANGINTLVIHTVPAALKLLKQHRKEAGGKMQWIICSTAPIEPGLAKYGESLQQLVDDGVDAIYLWGVHADKLIREGKVDMIAKAVEIASAHGIPSGVGAHDLEVVKACEQQKIAADFYIKTFHHHKYRTAPKPEDLKTPHSEIPGYWCKDPEETAQFMKTVEKPWIAFKVMAAGAIPPADAFRYVFNHGADFSLAGMFDFEIAEDVQIAKQVLANVKRARPWRG